MEHVWAKIPQFYRRLVGWADATEPPAHNKSSENSYRVPRHIFFENIIVLTTLKWAHMFSSIYYEQVALLHPPNRLASDETEEFLPKHVPHVQKDHIGMIHLALIPVGDR